MSACTPRMSTTRKPRKAQRSRIWKFTGAASGRKAVDNNNATEEEEEMARSLPRTPADSFLCLDSGDDENSVLAVEKSGRSFPGSHLSPSSIRGNSFSAAKKKQQQFAKDGYPPSGYLWIWMGVLRRWHRNHFLLETPGVLTHSRRLGSQMRGAFCLRDARVVPSRGHSRQFCIVSPAGVAYLRSMRKDQRGPWITSIRDSIEKYTQCVEQAERAHPAMNAIGIAVEPEDAKLEKEAKNRLQERMSELLPHQAALKWQMNQLTRKIKSVKEALNGDPLEAAADVSIRRRSSTENGGCRRLSSNQRSGGLHALHENRMIRHSSLTSELQVSSGEKSPGGESQPRRPVSAMSKVSTDDSSVQHGSSVNVSGLRDRAKMRKCQTPRPAVRKWNTTRQSPRAQRASPTRLEENGPAEVSVPLPAAKSPFQHRSQQESMPSLTDSGIWRSYQSFVDAVQRVIQKEVRTSIELEVENAALRRLLEMRRAEAPVPLDSAIHVTSGSTSRSYSTAESEFDVALLENSEDETSSLAQTRRKSAAAVAAQEAETQNQELMNALEVVRRAEYVTRNSSNSEALVTNLQSIIPPKDFEDDYDEESTFDQEEVVDLYGLEPRLRLPAPRPMQRGFSLWSVLKNAIGRDLSRVTMPATINEPLSALQRLVEEFEHASFLTQAALCPHPHERLMYITAFVLSSYNAALLRDSKPFNPLLGETFEWSNDQIRFVGEQVSHHPPVSCFHVQGFDGAQGEQLYQLHGEMELRSKFWGTTLNVFPTGRMELFLATTRERFVWNKAPISIHNLVLGQLWLDIHGEVQIKNTTTGDYAKIRLSKARGYAVDRGNLEGKIFSAQQKEIYSIDGNFSKAIYARKYPQSHRTEIFQAQELPPHAEDQYNMTTFAVGLNDPRGVEQGELPRTDSRFRTDIRALETGDFQFATSEKLRLEEKQRQTRKARKENGQKYIPMWFNLRRADMKDLSKLADQAQPSVWRFRDDYWKRKSMRHWGGCPDIF